MRMLQYAIGALAALCAVATLASGSASGQGGPLTASRGAGGTAVIDWP